MAKLIKLAKMAGVMHEADHAYLAFFQEFFQAAKSIVMQISFVMLIFLLFLDQISGGKSPRGQTASWGASLWKKASLLYPEYLVITSISYRCTIHSQCY